MPSRKNILRVVLILVVVGAAGFAAMRKMQGPTVEVARVKVKARFVRLVTLKSPTEAVTEKDLIYPLLSATGWGDLVHVQPNASAKGRADVPDALLFADEAPLPPGQ